MSYADLAAIILTGVAVIVTTLGVGVALATIWGISQFKAMTKSAAEEHVERLVKDGNLDEKIGKQVEQLFKDRMSDGDLRKILENRVDALLLTSAGDRERTNDDTKPFND